MTKAELSRKKAKGEPITQEVKKVKKSKAKGDYSARDCESCGKSFDPARFHPNQKFCPECSKSKRNSSPLPDKIDVTCECGKVWKQSKFLPYATTCPTCRNKAKAQKVKDKKAETQEVAEVKHETPKQLMKV